MPNTQDLSFQKRMELFKEELNALTEKYRVGLVIKKADSYEIHIEDKTPML